MNDIDNIREIMMKRKIKCVKYNNQLEAQF